MAKIKMKRKSEKSAIIFYQAKRQSDNPLTLERYIAEWKSHWNADFYQFKNEDGSFDDDRINEYFGAMFKAYDEKYGALSKEVMRGVRKEFALREVMPRALHKFADKRSLVIAKSNKKTMGYTLGGFSLFRKRDYHPIVCKKYDLSYHEICQFFDVSQADEDRYLTEYNADKKNKNNGNKKGSKKQQYNRKRR